MATNGFSVLEINFRGSSGYGHEFESSGYRQWGNEIQKDIIAGTRWAIEEHRADAGNICIMGGSFGAYSAVQSATLAPKLYNCVVANAGIYDLPLMYRKGDIESRYLGDEYLEKTIGRDKDELKRFSPVNRVALLERPIFIAHGKMDDRAPFEHAKRLRKALDKNNKQYEWFVKRREAHGFITMTIKSNIFRPPSSS
ncbi:MAG: prolyl oligopeptidase family serine peptidase [Gammaproteobacteria bacterium]|nr:prolyl oligopeptidase family serine peptidase [Gammaproteobacteria bacterium]